MYQTFTQEIQLWDIQLLGGLSDIFHFPFLFLSAMSWKEGYVVMVIYKTILKQVKLFQQIKDCLNPDSYQKSHLADTQMYQCKPILCSTVQDWTLKLLILENTNKISYNKGYSKKNTRNVNYFAIHVVPLQQARVN